MVLDFGGFIKKFLAKIARGLMLGLTLTPKTTNAVVGF